jgi:hypothetical protein
MTLSPSQLDDFTALLDILTEQMQTLLPESDLWHTCRKSAETIASLVDRTYGLGLRSIIEHQIPEADLDPGARAAARRQIDGILDRILDQQADHRSSILAAIRAQLPLPRTTDPKTAAEWERSGSHPPGTAWIDPAQLPVVDYIDIPPAITLELSQELAEIRRTLSVQVIPVPAE